MNIRQRILNKIGQALSSQIKKARKALQHRHLMKAEPIVEDAWETSRRIMDKPTRIRWARSFPEHQFVHRQEDIEFYEMIVAAKVMQDVSDDYEEGYIVFVDPSDRKVYSVYYRQSLAA